MVLELNGIIGSGRTAMQVSFPTAVEGTTKSDKFAFPAISPNAPDPYTYTPM